MSIKPVAVKNLLFLYNFVAHNLDEESKKKMDSILINAFGESVREIIPTLIDIFNKMNRGETLDDAEKFLVEAKLNISSDKYTDYQQLLSKMKSPVPNITEDPFKDHGGPFDDVKGGLKKRKNKRTKRIKKNKKQTKRKLRR